MRPLSLLFGRLLEERARRYTDGRAPSFSLSHPVLSIGNLTVGGTGKTPLVLHLAERFLAQGRTPAILSRGYGRASREVVVVSTGEGARVGPESGGDEPVLLATRLPGAIVVVAPRRADAARARKRSIPTCSCSTTDSSTFPYAAISTFSSWTPRIRSAAAGILRSAACGNRSPRCGGPTRSFSRGPLPAGQRRRALETVKRWNPDARVLTARIRPAGLRNTLGAADGPLPGTDFLAVCGIARPDSFRESLAELGLSPAQTLVFPDHCRYGRADLARIGRAAASTARARRS